MIRALLNLAFKVFAFIDLILAINYHNGWMGAEKSTPEAIYWLAFAIFLSLPSR